ncbi:zinc-ribbon domain-containing protein [Streptomyces sp. NPDC047869]|uniref:zinc-ribbon domain-containing protein n=1 Tax=Streptomyces sp. NPDC047869 TaxID=3154709 RepID=UPI0034570214
MADLNPDLAKELVKVIDDAMLTAWDIGPGSGKRCLWRCAACGHQWTTTPDQRTKRGTGCKACWERRRRGRAK